MDIALEPPATPWPPSIRGINNLPGPEKRAIYRSLILPWVYTQYQIDPQTLLQDGQSVVQMACPENTRTMELSLFHRPGARDPVLYMNLVDTFNNQIMVLLVIINDPEAPRYDIDVDERGESTDLGTRSRNIPAEIAAMEAGLAPGQIRVGLRVFRSALPLFEQFVARMGHDMFLIEPLSYHNAIMSERFGFSYLYGRQRMEAIHQDFLPGGRLHQLLDGSTPFRQHDAWQTVRGRSWAIHDGLLGQAFTGIQMYKRVGVEANVNTFPDAAW